MFFIIHGKMLIFVFVDKLLSFASLIPAMNFNLNSWWGMVTALGGCRGCGRWVYVSVGVHARVHTLSHVQLFVTPWTTVCQAPLSMEFSRQELEWVAISFSRRFWPRNWTRASWISCTGRQTLYHCVIWEAPIKALGMLNLSDTFKKVMNIELL